MQNISIENLLPKEIKAKQDEFLSLVPAAKDIRKAALQEALKAKFGQYWSDDSLYTAIQNSLIARGKLEDRKNAKKVAQSNELTDDNLVIPKDYKEKLLYNPMAEQIKDVWAKDQRFDDYYVQITAHRGAKDTGGTWTRPDITVIGYKTFPYVPGKHLEVITFEVKPFSKIDISGVYEALAHRRAATRSYLILHTPTEADLCLFNATDIVKEAGKFGIGVIVAKDLNDYYEWDVKLEAQRIEADPYKLNDFIEQLITDESKVKEQIAEWVKAK